MKSWIGQVGSLRCGYCAVPASYAQENVEVQSYNILYALFDDQVLLCKSYYVFFSDYVYSCMFSVCVCVCVATRHVEFLIIFMFRFVSIRLHNSVFICGFFEGCSFHSYMMLYEYFMSFLNDYMICCRFNLCSKICVFIQNIVFNI